MIRARQRATERFWTASNKVLRGDPNDQFALAVLNTVAQFDSPDVARLSSAAMSSLAAAQSRRNARGFGDLIAEVLAVADGDGPCVA